MELDEMGDVWRWPDKANPQNLGRDPLEPGEPGCVMGNLKSHKLYLCFLNFIINSTYLF